MKARNMDGLRKIRSVKEIFPDDINEMLVPDEYDEEDINGENCKIDEE